MPRELRIVEPGEYITAYHIVVLAAATQAGWWPVSIDAAFTAPEGRAAAEINDAVAYLCARSPSDYF